MIETRIDLARGDGERAASAARQVLDRLPATLGDRSRAELERLHLEACARCDEAKAASPKEPSAAAKPRRGGGMVGESRALHDALRRLERLALGDLPVLLYGETGTGKELAAQRAARASRRAASAPFVAVNCAALPESLLGSELFGHARGAFTGADRDRAGVFETAHGGDVFLDEIGELPSGAAGEAAARAPGGRGAAGGREPGAPRRRAGGGGDARDLDALVERGAFARTSTTVSNVAVVRLPPLRERGDDVLLLARHFLAAYDGRLRLARDAEQLLLACAWPGNVRELRSVLQVAAAMHEGDGCLMARDLELPPGPRIAASYHGALDAERRRLLGEALSAAGGRRAEAARRLGITPQAVSYLVRRLGLDAP